MATLRERRLFAAALLLSLLLNWGSASPVEAAESFAALSAAISAANGSGAGEITLSRDIVLTAVLPAITGRLAIDGGGHSISGDDAFRIFDVNGGALTLNNVTLSEGNAGEGAGGAIRMRNGGEVSLENSTLSANSARHGGAIATSGGGERLTIRDSGIAGNIAERSAGAIYANGGTLSITSSRFEKNCTLIASIRLIRSNRDKGMIQVDADGCLYIKYSRPNIEAALQYPISMAAPSDC